MIMTASWFYSGDFNNFSDEFFDNLGDVKCHDFPLEDVEPNDAGEDWQTKLQNLETPPLNVLESLSSDLCFQSSNAPLKVMKSSVVSYDQSSQPKHWLSSSDTKPMISTPLPFNSTEGKYSQTLQTCSPVSVLDSSGGSSTCLAENPNLFCLKFIVPVKRPRSKRCFTQRRSFPPMAFPCAYKRYRHFSALDLDAEYHVGELTSASLKRKLKKKKNLTQLSSEVEATEPSMEPAETRKCTHCQVTKTPQWREGPMGPKTLCNACGVRYRSGRLFPEYRPAASPTFIPSMHSNSHRKVLEIRKKTSEVTASAEMKPPIFSMGE